MEKIIAAFKASRRTPPSFAHRTLGCPIIESHIPPIKSVRKNKGDMYFIPGEQLNDDT